MKEKLLEKQQKQSPLLPAESSDSDGKGNVMELEGQCRIKTTTLLRINYPKGIFFGLILTVSVVGLLLLKYFKKLRAVVFYDTLNANQVKDATHIYVKGESSSIQEIAEVRSVAFNNKNRRLFQFKKLRYELKQDARCLPLEMSYVEDLEEYKNQQFLKKGLTQDDALDRQNLYGRNEHQVEIPSYFQFIFDTMTQPLFLFQYIVSLIYILESFVSFAFIMIFFGFATTTINYILLLRSYKKIKETAQKRFNLKVLRNGGLVEIVNFDLVPGDIYVPCDEIPCDSIVLKGQLFVDEVSLTGQNVPIAKFKLNDSRKIHDKSHWLYQGSKLQTMKDNTLALAVHVGYGSRRGRIIRKILTKITQQPQSFKKLIIFQIQVLVVSVFVFLATLPRMYEFEIDGIMKVLRFWDFVTYSFPAPYPILFNLAYSFCLMRLRKCDVAGTDAEKTVEGSRLKTICFDKTGTLTQNKMQVSNVYHIKSRGSVQQITTRVNQNPMISDLFASCNSVETINREVKGDQIDLRLFEYTNSRLQESVQLNVVRDIKVHGRTLEVLKINQYQSQFQSMSVLIRQTQSDRHYIYIKGSPEMVHQYSTLKFDDYEQFIKKLSFSGYRSIGFGFKQIQRQQIEQYMNADREEFLNNTTILGVVTFINQLKRDAIQTISTLAEAEINTKIITGDNIFLGVQTAFLTGMIANDKKVIIVEGSKYDRETGSIELLELTHSQTGQIIEQHHKLDQFSFNNKKNEFYAIDNDFIRARPDDFLNDQVKVFARISPENKALIVKKHKQIYQAVLANRKGAQKFFGDCSFKVGMVGDGANDLIAIKQADLGIGISSSDAIYSASFAIGQLSQIIQIILQAKNTERIINEMTKYYGITQFLSIVNTVILTEDCSYFTSIQLIYKNFINTLLITFCFSMCNPFKKLIKAIPNSNYLDLENHLIFWGHLVICSLGLIGSYVYYANSDDFEPNVDHRYCHFEEGWYGLTKSSTANFIAANITYVLLSLVLYKSKPWKQPIWNNKPLFAIILINAMLIILISLFNEHMSLLDIQPIGTTSVLIIWLIILLTGALCIAYKLILEKIVFRRREINRSQLTTFESLHEYS